LLVFGEFYRLAFEVGDQLLTIKFGSLGEDTGLLLDGPFAPGALQFVDHVWQTTRLLPPAR